MSTAPDTTNISDLPIVHTQPTNNDEMIRNLQQSTEMLQQDKEAVIHSLQQEKKVRFEDTMNGPELPLPSTKDEPAQFVLSLEHKIIVLAVFFFFVFSDPKFRKYILNILVQIFGNFLKTETGNLTKIGMFVYSIFYGLCLLVCVSFIDFTSFHLAF